jgi:hypothetical protein
MEDTANQLPMMSLVTDHKEFAPVRDVLAAFEIDRDNIVVRRESTLVPGAAKFTIGRRIEIEIRGAAAWAMTEEQRKPAEDSLRDTVERIVSGADLRISWCRPVDIEWVVACIAIQDKLYRDWHRRRIDDDAFHAAHWTAFTNCTIRCGTASKSGVRLCQSSMPFWRRRAGIRYCRRNCRRFPKAQWPSAKWWRCCGAS